MRNLLLGTVAIAIVLPVVTGCGRGAKSRGDDQKSATAAPDDRTPDSSHKRQKPPPVPFGRRFSEMPPATTGVDFRHVSGDSEIKPFPAANGSGVGALDYDLDGRYDLYFATGTTFPLDTKRTQPVNRCYRNRGGWRFEDVTAETRLGHNGYSAGIAVGDFDADGLPDVYVTCFGRNVLYHNRGDGTFEPVNDSVAGGGNFSTSVAFLDYDNDGLLDLYVCNYGDWSLKTNQFCGNKQRGVRIFCSPKTLQAEPDVLLRNAGDGRFEDVTKKAGLADRAGRGQGVLAADVNADGRIDLYLGNDIHPNLLFKNVGGGKFEDVSEHSGASYDRVGRMQAGMGVAGADVNRDGRWDLFVTNFENEHHTLYLQSPSGGFDDVSQSRGITAPSRPWVGWGTAFIDANLDGWKDLVVTNGHVDNNLKLLGRDSPYDHPALLWKNEKGHFRLLGAAAGEYFGKPHPGRGLAVSDLDNDGDGDLVIVHQDQPPALLRNDPEVPEKKRSHSAVLRLIGTKSNRDAVGSRIEIATSPGEPVRLEQIQGGGSYLSAHDRRVVVALPDGQAGTVTIHWPSGITSTVEKIDRGDQYDIIEPAHSSARTVVLTKAFSSLPKVQSP